MDLLVERQIIFVIIQLDGFPFPYSISFKSKSFILQTKYFGGTEKTITGLFVKYLTKTSYNGM